MLAALLILTPTVGAEGATSAAGTVGKTDSYAWLTLLSGNSENTTNLALLQIASVNHFSRFGHVTMVTPDVRSSARVQLIAAGSHVVEVEPIEPPAMVAPWWATVFTKLRAFSLSRHQLVTYLDLDAFLASDRADTVFDSCDATEICALR